ncbi:hypothetical protein HYN59_11485 [Flavobacterium album]|uniref:Lipoprotein n=1 Tax=Flavobacterium album TaxID=2175091 RepID=A0A2S1QZ68_9FLAO|nr:DUF6146 family protein [Flavobacterium album]AWH85690.1 hypothetical protein HYN59_11485 [Flavobacterium album]
MRIYITIIAVILAVTIGCGTKDNVLYPANANANEIAASAVNDTVRIANDSLEYEVIIIDPGFTTWLASRARQRGYYSQPYLQNKNRFWVTEWNTRVMEPQRYGDLYQMRIDYNYNVDYGYEVNYLLFNYLVYFQITNNQKLGGIVPYP